MGILMVFYFALLMEGAFSGSVPDISGGDTGDNGNDFLDGTPNTDKLVMGAQCVQGEGTIGVLTMTIHENDDGFKYETGDNAGERVMYGGCFMLDTEQLLTTGDIVKVDGCDFSRMDTSTEYGKVTFTKELSIDFNPAASPPCGGFRDGANIDFSVECKRTAGYDKAFDIIFKINMANEIDTCTVAEVTSNDILVALPPVKAVESDYEVTMIAYKVNAALANDYPSAEGATGATKISGSIAVGSTIFLEICLSIPGTDPPKFPDDGFSPIGVYPTSCYASPSDNIPADIVDLKEYFTDGSGCPSAAEIVNIPLTKYTWPYVSDASEPTGVLLTPNCFRFPFFEATSFKRQKKDLTAGVTYTCDIAYCYGSDATECFGDGASPGESYPTCSSGGRRKREANDSNLPTTASVTVNYILPDTPTNEGQLGCFEMNTFIGLASTLGGLIAIVLLIAAYLAYRLSSYTDDHFSSSIDSMTGMQNKAYY